MVTPPTPTPKQIGRYQLCELIASGGMASVYLGRLEGATGFSRPVAIKRLHPHLATNPSFVAMLVDEARLAARVRHPNVVPSLDVIEDQKELAIVMEYVEGVSLSALQRVMKERGEPIPPRLAVAIVVGALHGLHAAHEARGERGEPLGIVHRDVSPQNILVGVDGVVRVADFGVAKAAGRVHSTETGAIKGKVAYMAPEQAKADKTIDRTADLRAAAVVLWECLVGRRPFSDEDVTLTLTQILFNDIEPPSRFVPDLPAALDEIITKAASREPSARYATALEMADALEAVYGVVSPRELGAWFKDVAQTPLEDVAKRLALVEAASGASEVRAQGRRAVERVSAGASADAPAVLPETEFLGSADAKSALPRRRLLIPAVAVAVVVLLGISVLLAARRGEPSRSAAVEAPEAGTALAATSDPSVDASVVGVAAADTGSARAPAPTHSTHRSPAWRPPSRPTGTSSARAPEVIPTIRK